MKPRLAFAAGALLVAALPLVCGLDAMRPLPARGGEVAWPRQIDGRVLTRLPLAAAEQRFARGFPGAIARFTDGRREFVLRSVERPTRMLHPAVDCFRGLGYDVSASRLTADEDGRTWNCFEALRAGRTLRVCERIVDGRGRSWTDVSAWYWAAALGRTSGPWSAVTKVSAP